MHGHMHNEAQLEIITLKALEHRIAIIPLVTSITVPCSSHCTTPNEKGKCEH